MQGLMMGSQLTITELMRHAEKLHHAQEIVSFTQENPRHRYTFKDCFGRARQLANALHKLGLKQGDIVGSLAWNDYRHMELYYASACSGMICHTVNPRLFPEQIVYMLNHAEDKWMFIDPMFMPLLESIQDQLEHAIGFIVLCDEANMPTTTLKNAQSYEALIAPHSDEFDWPELNENQACSLCYTSGTTGNPKGALYSHRALLLQSYACSLADSLGLKSTDCVMPIVPMFHVNAWNIPYVAALTGFKLVFPGSKMGDGVALQELIEEESVTMSAGVPTVWLNLLTHLRESGKKVESLKKVLVGGAACPLSVMEEFENSHGVYTHLGWGMTELSPLGTFNSLPRAREAYSDEEYAKARVRSGRSIFGIEMKIVDDNDEDLPWDGVAFGTLKVRGPWVIREYFKQGKSALDDKGWFDTGDVATIDQDGSMMITDRTKDVIKSGGEWISSIDLENCAVGHPDVAEAAVIGVAHPKWTERPMLIIVRNPDSDVQGQAILDFMDGKVAKWWMPDAVEFVDELPHTATGKIQKVELRKQFSDYQLKG